MCSIDPAPCDLDHRGSRYRPRLPHAEPVDTSTSQVGYIKSRSPLGRRPRTAEGAAECDRVAGLTNELCGRWARPEPDARSDELVDEQTAQAERIDLKNVADSGPRKRRVAARKPEGGCKERQFVDSERR